MIRNLFSAVFEANGPSVRRENSKQTNNPRIAENYHEPVEYMNTTDEEVQKPLLPELTVYLSDLGKYIKNKSMAEFEEEFEVSVI